MATHLRDDHASRSLAEPPPSSRILPFGSSDFHPLFLHLLTTPGASRAVLLRRLLRDRSQFLPRSLRQIRGARLGMMLDRARCPDPELLTHPQVAKWSSLVPELLWARMLTAEPDWQDLELLLVEHSCLGNAVMDWNSGLRIALVSVSQDLEQVLASPGLLRSAHGIIINQMELVHQRGLPWLPTFERVRQVAPQALVFPLSAVSGQGLASFYGYLSQALCQHQRQCSALAS